MKTLAKIGLAGLLVAASVTANPAVAKEKHRPHKDKDATAAVIAGVLGLGVGIAIARHGKNHDNDYQWDDDVYGRPFSPADNVYCYPKQRTCYRNNRIAYKWTRQIFGDY